MTTYTGFGTGTPASLTFAGDVTSVNIGSAFYVNTTGLYLTKIRFYWPHATAANAVQVGLFAAGTTGATGSAINGTTGSFTPQANKWNEYLLPTPYALTSNTVYYAVVWTPGTNGGYGAQSSVFASAVNASPIIFPANNSSTFGNTVKNGAFIYNAALTAPTNSGAGSTWYGVDIEVSDLVIAGTSPWVFVPPPGLITPTSRISQWAKTAATVTTTPATAAPALLSTVSTFPAATITATATVTPTRVNTLSTFPASTITSGSSATVNPALLATLTSFPTASVTRTETVTPSRINTLSTFPAISVSTLSGVITGFGSTIPGGFAQSTDVNSVTLATRFRVTAGGYQAIKVRLWVPSGGVTPPTTGYKGAIYSSGTTGAVGTPLAQANFGTISLNTWNEVTISAVPLSAGTDYYVAALVPAGHYGFLANYFTTTISTNSGTLLLIGDSTTSYNGAYAYGAALTTPNQHYNATFYGVDVAIGAQTPLPATINTTTTFPAPSITLGKTVTPATIATTTTLPTVVQPNSLTHLVITPGGRQSSGTNTITFTAYPVNANDVLVLCISGGAGTNPITVASAGVTWHERIHKDGATGTASIWTALFPTTTTVDITITAAQNYLSAQPYNVQGYATPYYNATGSGSTTAQNNTLAIFTSTGVASEGFVVTADVTAGGAITSTDLSINQTTLVGQLSSASGYKALGAAGAKTAVVDYGSATPSASWAALEIRDVSSQMPLPNPIQSLTTFPAASIHIAQTRAVATINALTTFPAATVTIRKDATVTPARINTLSTMGAVGIIHPVPASLLRTFSTFPAPTVFVGITVHPARINTTTSINQLIPRLTYTLPGQSYGDAIYGLSYYSGGLEWTLVNGWQYVLLTAGFTNPDGSPASGWLEFNLSSNLVDAGNGIIITAEPFRMKLDANGRVAVPLYSTDQHNITPVGWHWTVTEMIDGWDQRTISFTTPMSTPVLPFVTIG